MSDNLNNKIDEDLYSRQIIFLGMETMKKISQLKILIIGVRGLGIEIAKDIIVSGPNQVTIFDPNEAKIEDLGSNFYLSEKDIGKRRDESCLPKLKMLNKYVNVNFLEETSIQNIIDKIPGKYNVIVVSEIKKKKNIVLLDEISRKNNICLIYSAICGLTSFIFTDFGPNFTIIDEACSKKRKFLVKNIEKSEKGLVEIEIKGNKDPNIKEYIIFKEVEGMTEINYSEEKKNIFKIEAKDANSFYIGNTLNYSEYKSGGYIEETAKPKTMSYESFIKSLENPFDNDYDYVNHQKKLIFLIFMSLMEFYDKNERLTFLLDKNDFEEIKLLTRQRFDNLKNTNSKIFEEDDIVFNENIIKKLSFSASAEIPCMTSLIGGIVCQEIIKVTGKFRPINQWKIFDFLQFSSNNNIEINYNINKTKTKYDELISVFGDNVIEKVQNLNILLAGAGALGCELLKNLSLLGISNSVLVIDDDNIEISNLNRQFLFQEKHKGMSKASVACNSAKEINSDIKCSFYEKRISPENKNIFNKSYFNDVDFVLGAIDSQEGNYYLVKQCELFEKIFIKGATKGPEGKVECFIPKITCSYNDLEVVKEEEEEKSPSCTRREFPGKIEDCLDNGRDLFDEYFVTLIIDFLKIINKEKLLKKLDVENEIDKFNKLNKIIFFIKNNLILDNSNGKNLDKQLIKYGLEEFYKLFSEEIKNIYKKHPINDTEESTKFWKNKRIPTELEFNVNDELSFNFLLNFIKIFSKMLNIDFPSLKDKAIFKSIVEDCLNEMKNENYANCNLIDPETLFIAISKELDQIQNNECFLEKIKSIKPVNFEKDIPSLGHIQFVHNFANLKAKSYKIPLCDKFYTLQYVGKIAPTTITSTAAVGGYMTLQMIRIVINQINLWGKDNYLSKDFDDIDDEELKENGLHNFYCNLKTNDYFLEQFYKEDLKGKWEVNDLIPIHFSRWYKIYEKGNKTLGEFINYINEKYQIDCSLILSAEDDQCLYKKTKKRKIINKKLEESLGKIEERLNKNIEDVYFDFSQTICKQYNRNNYIFLKIKGFSKNHNYVELPTIQII